MPQNDLTSVSHAQNASAAPRSRKVPRIVVLGGGSVGLYVARRLRRKLKKREAAIVVVDPRPYMTYAPFLPEASAGSIDDRDVVAPHRRALKGVDVLQGKVTRIEHGRKHVQITPEEGEPYEVSYDQLVVGLGSVSRTLPIPGLAETAIGFKNVEEAIAVRNHVINRLDLASSTWDAELRKRMLTFTFVGAGFAGIEALAEIEDMARYATRQYNTIDPEDLRFVMIEGTGRILPEVTEPMSLYALDKMKERGIEFHLNTFLSSCEGGHVVTSTGVEFDSDTIVWTAGVKANPVIKENSDLPVDKLGRATVKPTLQVAGEDGVVVDGAWAAGDCAAVPDLVNPGAFCPPNAQHAIRQAKRLADNIVAEYHGKAPRDYEHKNLGVVASLGLYQGVAELFGWLKLRGPLAWLAHRGYHLMAMPTFTRKSRILGGWISQFFLGRELVSLGSLHDPRSEFREASVPPKPKEEVVQNVTVPAGK
ncbi:NAD(P)/FAD-dependent oxidoreductase [Myceligenerans pegani]|uniref:NAD(P)/FAD-dependent oxidoreductase n=1 Tax=Myceligenerans pegani TaxID=2776917 RepID=A0ABR9MUD0_9MICO|nr:NAD(P)/FAD-dependent oxidoreductase [Myceligenerans sp. TRM 65318]MBE1874493.1 NAD(P)/FAD-dependent oxidoreductase [Myceligenerans sp. TRM 65318]MBE3016764.1 NAD(P)/FAD-dependent oxidoreductase [Myceligenerans sp. TRM 65318]